MNIETQRHAASGTTVPAGSGSFGGKCNRTVCTMTGADVTWWNVSTQAVLLYRVRSPHYAMARESRPADQTQPRRSIPTPEQPFERARARHGVWLRSKGWFAMKITYWSYTDVNEDGTFGSPVDPSLGSIRPEPGMATSGSHWHQTPSTQAAGLWMSVCTGRLPDGTCHGITISFRDEAEMHAFEQNPCVEVTP